MNCLSDREVTVRTEANHGARGVSRREFLRAVGTTSVAGGVLAAAPAEEVAAAGPAAPVGPGEVSITLHVNGQERTLSVEPRTTLLDALRNRLDLTGSKKVCDRGTCGACTVLKDGRPIYACTALAIDVQGSKIVTIEGLGAPDRLSPVQAAFVKNDAMQCGFCTPGFVVAATAFLRDQPNPTAEQVRAALGGNFCRCGAYRGIEQAVLDAANTVKGGA
jgi:xanthine dehydrogenase YagT iron-sulfur-binding subunit